MCIILYFIKIFKKYIFFIDISVNYDIITVIKYKKYDLRKDSR